MTMNLRGQIWGRPVKPVALGLLISLLLIARSALTDTGVLGSSTWADVLAGAALAGAVTLGGAWWLSSQRLAEWGLVVAFAIWTARMFAIALLSPTPLETEGLLLSLAWSVIAGGSYLLERLDPADRVR